MLIDSVADLVKTISSSDEALRNAPHALARRLEIVGSGVGEIVQPAMHVGVFVVGRLVHALDDLPRLLRRGGVVEVDELLAVRLSSVSAGKSARIAATS